jgi:hypothetical protein
VTDPTLPPHDWPARIVSAAATAHGVTLYFPPLRAWSLALRLGVFGAAMLVPAWLAAQAFAPGASSHAGAMLSFVLTAAFVYPLVVFGAVFLLVALVTVSTSLTVSAEPDGLRAVRRLLTIKVSDRTMPSGAGAVLEREPHNVPRLFGGSVYFRIVALGPVALTGKHGRYSVTRLVVADGIPDEALAQSIAALLARCSRIRRTAEDTPDGFSER